MKKTIVFVFAVFFVLIGCSSLDNTSGIEEDNCLVRFNIVGEIKTNDVPITKTSTNDIYFIQVYQGSSAFAMGFFDDISKMYFYLKKGSNYRIVVSLLRNQYFGKFYV